MHTSATALLLALAAAAAVAQNDNCGLTRPLLKAGDASLDARSVWLSVFDGTSTGGNPNCALGQTGQIMATVLLQETGSACMTAPQLAILGPKSYYRLELSEDGTVVRRLNAGCFEHTCSDCKYDHALLNMDECVTEPGDSGEPFSFALVRHTEGSSAPCIGPYTVTNTSSVTAVADIDISNDANVVCNTAQSTNCSAALFALTLTEAPSQCVSGSVFHGLLTYAYSITNDNNVYSMNFCSNVTTCSSSCSALFKNLPIGVCRPTMFGQFNAHVELRTTQSLVVCRDKQPWPLSWIMGAVGGAIAVTLGLVVVVFQYRRRKHRQQRAVGPMSPGNGYGYGTINN